MAQRPEANVFARTVRNLVRVSSQVEHDYVFGLGAATFRLWTPRPGIRIVELLDLDGEDIRVLGTMAIKPSEIDFRMDVVSGDGKVTLWEGFRCLEAAFGYVLDELAAPIWRLSQSTPDPVAV